MRFLTRRRPAEDLAPQLAELRSRLREVETDRDESKALAERRRKDIENIVREKDRLIKAQAERVAAQSELLAKAAERAARTEEQRAEIDRLNTELLAAGNTIGSLEQRLIEAEGSLGAAQTRIGHLEQSLEASRQAVEEQCRKAATVCELMRAALAELGRTSE